MQFPSARSERLILAPSNILIPLFSETAALSDPARSTRHNLLVVIVVFVPSSGDSDLIMEVYSIVKVRIACERELNSFWLVDAIYLRVLPIRILSSTCCSSTTSFSVKSGTKTPLLGSSITMRLSLFYTGESKSPIYSLYISK